MDEQTRRLTKKYESNINLSGKSMLLFGLWDVFKFLANYLYGEADEYKQQLQEILQNEMIPSYIEWILVVFICFFIFSFNFYIGVKAIGYSKGKRRKVFFLIIAVILAVMTLTGIPLYFEDFNVSDLDSIIAAILMDLAFVYMIFDMIYSAIRLRNINRQIPKEA